MNSGKIIFVTGGQRSGKSVFAEKTALSLSSSPIYVATAQLLDDEMHDRVKKHRERRGPQWTTFEAPVELASIPLKSGDTVLLDCVTIWASNCFFRFNEDINAALSFMKNQADTITASGANIIFVTNEIGLGGTSPNAMQRHFTDLQGYINQHLATISTEAWLLISGIPLKLK